MSEHHEIDRAIRLYAESYEIFERHSAAKQPLFPLGDHKTGAIAEYYAYWYLKLHEGETNIEWEPPHREAWDFKKSDGGKVQVKAVSDWNTNKKIRVKSEEYDELFLFELTKDFRVRSFHVVEKSKLKGKLRGDFTWRSKAAGGQKCGLLAQVDAITDKTEDMLRVVQQLTKS